MLPIPVGAHQQLVSTGYGAIPDMRWGHFAVQQKASEAALMNVLAIQRDLFGGRNWVA